MSTKQESAWGAQKEAPRVVMLRFFAGLKVEQIAELLDVTRRTVSDDWSMARACLVGKLTAATEDEPFRDGDAP